MWTEKDSHEFSQACEVIVTKIEKFAGNETEILRNGVFTTHMRMTNAYRFLIGGYDEDPDDYLRVVFDEGVNDLVIIDNIDFFSLCEHHLLPFYGLFHIGYIPNDKGQILGASKIPRVVDIFARRIQNQERLGCQIANAMMNSPACPKGVIVFGEAVHMCMRMRGVESSRSTMKTFAVRGLFKTDQTLEARFYQMLKAGRVE